jgi:thiol-disulfide isomerase/thioredoxin
MRLFIIGFILIVSLIVYKALFLDSSHKQTQADPSTAFHIDGNATATFTFKDTEGKEYVVAQYGDRFIVEGYDNNLVVFNFFGTYCPACRQEIPMLTELKEKYGDKVQIIGVSVDKDLSTEQLKDFQDEMDVEFSMSAGKGRLLHATCSTLPEEACHFIPLTVVYSKGKLQTYNVGAEELSYIENLIAK